MASTLLLLCTAADRDAANASILRLLPTAGDGNLHVPCTTNASGAADGSAEPTHFAALFASLPESDFDTLVDLFSGSAALALQRKAFPLPDTRATEAALAGVGVYVIKEVSPGPHP